MREDSLHAPALLPGTVCVLIDESYEPFVAAAAVSIDIQDLDAVEQRIAHRYECLSQDFHLRGLGSFEEFLESGFHATSDTTEVSVDFIRFLAQTISFKTSIVFSDGSTRPDLSEKKRLMIVLDQLIRDVLRQHRGRPGVHLIFESAQGMDAYVHRVAERVIRRLGNGRTNVTIEFGRKRNPYVLAIPDYVLHIFNAWHDQLADSPNQFVADEFKARNLRAVLGSISEARSVEGNVLLRRDSGIRQMLDS